MFNISVLLDVQANLPETSPFFSAQMALVSTFFQIFIVLAIYNFAWLINDKTCKKSHSFGQHILLLRYIYINYIYTSICVVINWKLFLAIHTLNCYWEFFYGYLSLAHFMLFKHEEYLTVVFINIKELETNVRCLLYIRYLISLISILPWMISPLSSFLNICDGTKN